MSRPILIVALLAALIISGCSSSKPESLKSGLPSLEGEWMISMAHSGGIMGLSRSIKISSDGKYTVVDERANKSVTRELEKDELSKLMDIVASSEYITMTLPQPSGCADCFVYDLAIQGNGKKFSVQVDDVSMPDSGMETLVMYLRDLMDAALK